MLRPMGSIHAFAILTLTLLATASHGAIPEPKGNDTCDPTTELSGEILTGGEVTEMFELTPDGLSVIFLADRDGDNRNELYRVPVGGGPEPKRLDSFEGTEVQITDFAVGPDGTVVFRADGEFSGEFQLFGVNPETDAVMQLTQANHAGADVFSTPKFQITPDGSRVIYVADGDTDGVLELYSVGVGSGPAVKLNGMLVDGGFVQGFQLAPDGNSVVYIADQDTDNVAEIYTVPVDGSSDAFKINVKLEPNTQVRDFFFSGNSQRVIYRLRPLNSFDIVGFHSVLNGMGVREPQDDVDIEVPEGRSISEYHPTNDGTRVLIRGDLDRAGTDELYTVTVDPVGTPVKLHEDLGPDQDINIFTTLSKDDYVAFTGELNIEGRFDLFVVPADGSEAPRQVNEALGEHDFIFAYRFDSISSRLFYTVFNSEDLHTEFWDFDPESESGAVQLDPGVSDRAITAWEVTPDASTVVYRRDSFTEPAELMQVDLDGGNRSPILGPDPQIDPSIFMTSESGVVLLGGGQCQLQGRIRRLDAPSLLRSLRDACHQRDGWASTRPGRPRIESPYRF